MPTQATPFELIGGEHTLRRLVDRFYDLMDVLPEVEALRRLHPADLGASRDKLHEFLCGWLGGPPLYEQRYGHPRLRARHLPFAIDSAMRDQWLLCMRRALAETGVDASLRTALERALAQLADHLRNRADCADA